MVKHGTSIILLSVKPKSMLNIPLKTPIFTRKRPNGNYVVEYENDGILKMFILSADEMKPILEVAIEIAWRENGKNLFDAGMTSTISGDDYGFMRGTIIRMIKEWFPRT